MRIRFNETVTTELDWYPQAPKMWFEHEFYNAVKSIMDKTHPTNVFKEYTEEKYGYSLTVDYSKNIVELCMLGSILKQFRG